MLDYELMQFSGLWNHIHSDDPIEERVVLRNALIEATVLHMRIILEMLRKKPDRMDDYSLGDLIDLKDTPKDLAALMSAYTKDETYAALVEQHFAGNADEIEPLLKLAPEKQINKLMFHPTTNRPKGFYDWAPVLQIIPKMLCSVINELKRCAVR